MLNPAGLRRFPSPHSSLFFLDFWWNFRAQMRREGEGLSLYRGYPRSPAGGRGDRPPAATVGRAQRRSPVGRATGPCRPPNGRQGLFFLFSPGTSLQILKKITHWACRPMGGRPGYIFKIFQNGHIFLNFFKYKKEKTVFFGRVESPAPAQLRSGARI